MDAHTLVYFHPDCLLHDTGATHPERADRVSAIHTHIKNNFSNEVLYQEAPLATLRQLSRVHPPSYIRFVLEKLRGSGKTYLDPDTIISSKSGDAAFRAAGAVCAAIDAVIDGAVSKAFCLTRPPGHHAEPTRAMGFCILNNVAIGALHARHHHDIKRIAIIDFDVHHGNGTQRIFETDENTLFISSHEMPLFPGTGSDSQKGVGNILNIPLHPRASGEDFQKKWKLQGLPRLRAFQPELILISAGFDGHQNDPLASINLTTEDYAWLTEEIVKVAEIFSKGRVISTLEGGYDLAALCESVAAHIMALKPSQS